MYERALKSHIEREICIGYSTVVQQLRMAEKKRIRHFNCVSRAQEILFCKQILNYQLNNIPFPPSLLIL